MRNQRGFEKRVQSYSSLQLSSAAKYGSTVGILVQITGLGFLFALALVLATQSTSLLRHNDFVERTEFSIYKDIPYYESAALKQQRKTYKELIEDWNAKTVPDSSFLQLGAKSFEKSFNPCADIKGSKHCLPNFVVAGFPKCGTTAFFNFICTHPQIKNPARKELLYLQGSGVSMERYSEWFPKNISSEMITGEATPSYGWHARLVVNNILKITPPTTKVILLVRNPVDAVFSLYRHLRTFVAEWNTGSLASVWRQQVAMFRACLEDPRLLYDECFMIDTGYLRRTLVTRYIYAYHVKPFLQALPDRRVLVLESEKFFSETPKVLNEVSDWLGLERHNFHAATAQTSVRMLRNYASDIKEAYLELRDEMVEFYHPYNLELYDLIGQRFDWSVPGKTNVDVFNPLRIGNKNYQQNSHERFPKQIYQRNSRN